MEISYSSWPWHRSDATALAGYANMMMMMMTPSAGVSQTLRRRTRNGITDLSQRAPPIFGRAAIMLGIGPHSSFFAAAAYSQLQCGLLGKYLLVSELHRPIAHIVRQVGLLLCSFGHGSSLLWTHALRPFINRPIALTMQAGEEFLVNDMCKCMRD